MTPGYLSRQLPFWADLSFLPFLVVCVVLFWNCALIAGGCLLDSTFLESHEIYSSAQGC